MDCQRVRTGTEWEPRFGYSRALRVGDRVLVSGTTATDDAGHVVAPGDPVDQAEQAFENVADALAEAGAALEDVVRTRLYVTDADDWEAIAPVHRSYVGDAAPAATLVEVSGLIHEDLVVEVEAVVG